MLKKTLATVLCAIIAFSFVTVGVSAVGIPAAPTGLTMEYGSKLSDIKLDIGFVWTSDNAIARYKLGDNTFILAYDSNNDGIYEAENIEVIVKVVCTKHSWGEYKSNGDATWIKDGTKTRTCKICGAQETVADVNSAKLYVKAMELINSDKISSAVAKVLDTLITVFNKVVSFAGGAIGKIA